MSAAASAEQKRGGDEDVACRPSSPSSASTGHSASTAKSSASRKEIRQQSRRSSASRRRSSASGASSAASVAAAAKSTSKTGQSTYGAPPAKVPPTNRMVPAPLLDRYYRRAVRWTAAFWFLLVAAVLYFSPPESFRRQESATAAGALGAASVVMGASVLTRALALLAQSMFVAANGGEQTVGISGAALVGLFAQTSSCVMNGAMALYATPSFVDPVTGMRVFLLRWCEWAPLAFVMAFLTASIDAEEESKSGVQSAMKFALCQGVSTTLGLILPVLTSIPAWYCTLGLSVLLHLTLHPLMVQKTLAVLSVSDPTSVSLRESSNEQRKNRILVGGHLIQLLTAAWTLLVVLYIAAWFFHLPLGVNAVLECTADVVSKHFYLNYLIEAHHLIFSKMRKEDLQVAEKETGKKKEKKVEVSSDGSSAANAALPRVKASQQQENVAIVFARGERAASLLVPADVPRTATLLEAARSARSINKAVFQKAKKTEGAAAAKKEKTSEVTFLMTLRDGTDVPFTLEQAGKRTLDEIVNMRGGGDAPKFEVVVIEEEEEEENDGNNMEDLIKDLAF